jgi:hypothetical protein
MLTWVGEPVTRRRQEQTGTDRYGNPVYELVDVVLEERAGFDPGGSREAVEVGRTQTITTPKLYFRRAYPDLNETDQVVVRGVVFDIEGIPADWKSPYGSDIGGLVVELKRAEG